MPSRVWRRSCLRCGRRLNQIGAGKRAQYDGSADGGAGFEAVHLFQLRLIHGFADVGKVDGLSARHAEAAGCFGERGQHGDLAFGGQSGRTAQYVEGLGLQGVADKRAVASSYFTWQVGLPRRRLSLSIAGISSWTKE